jgi:hypothetical protein
LRHVGKLLEYVRVSWDGFLDRFISRRVRVGFH